MGAANGGLSIQGACAGQQTISPTQTILGNMMLGFGASAGLNLLPASQQHYKYDALRLRITTQGQHQLSNSFGS